MSNELEIEVNKLKHFYYEYFTQGNSYDEEIFFEKAIQKLGWPNMPEIIKERFTQWRKELYTLKCLTQYLNKDVEELIFHGHEYIQVIYKDHREVVKSNFSTKEEFEHLLSYLAMTNKQSWNFKNPFVSFNLVTLKGALRCSLSHFILSSKNQSKIFLRTKAANEVIIKDFTPKEDELDNFLTLLVKEKKNIIISGATGSGKTTLLNLLLKTTSEEEHLLILEDTQELSVNHRTVTKLIANEDNNLKDLLKYSLRMKPDRIALGEMRSDEVIPYILAMNTGHSGMMATIHANNAIETIDRLCLLFEFYHQKEGLKYETIQKMICQSLEYVIFVKDKKCCEIIRLISSGDDGPVFETVYQASGMSQKYFEPAQSLSLLA